MPRVPKITDGKGDILALPPSQQAKPIPGIVEMLKLPSSSNPLPLPAPPSKKDKKDKKGKAQEPILVVVPKFDKVKFSNDDGQYSRERPVQTVREFGLFEDFVGSGRPDPFFL